MSISTNSKKYLSPCHKQKKKRKNCSFLKRSNCCTQEASLILFLRQNKNLCSAYEDKHLFWHYPKYAILCSTTRSFPTRKIARAMKNITFNNKEPIWKDFYLLKQKNMKKYVSSQSLILTLTLCDGKVIHNKKNP